MVISFGVNLKIYRVGNINNDYYKIIYKRNYGLGVNAIQSKFTAMLKVSLHNHRVDYIKGKFKNSDKEVPLDDYSYRLYGQGGRISTINIYNVKFTHH